MNIQHLKYAVEVERTGSITQAADNLFMGQPNLSKAIKELETTLGVVIFRRTSKGVVITSKGREFLLYAKNILARIDEMESLYRPGKTEKQVFSISVPRGSYIANAFTRFIGELDHEKEMEITFTETNSMQAISNIVEEGYNLGIIRYPERHESYFLSFLAERELLHEILWNFEYLALMSTQHPLAGREEVPDDTLSGYVEIVHGDSAVPFLSLGEMRREEKSRCSQRRIYVCERGSQFDLLTHIPDAFMWVSPVPEETLRRYGLVQRKCRTDRGLHKDTLIYPKGYKFASWDTVFLGKLGQVRDEVAAAEYT